MKALSKIQSTVMFQAAELDDAASKFSQKAKAFVAFGALIAAVLVSQGAQAQQSPLTPSNCAVAGSMVGGAIGANMGNSNVAHIAGGVLMALGGAAVGNWACSPNTPSRDASYNNAANYGNGGNQKQGNQSGFAVDRQAVKTPLSINERDFMDNLSKEALDAKYTWKKALWGADQASQKNSGPAMQTALETEAQARQEFEQKRDNFSTTVAKLNNGVAGVEPRAVGRYIEISAALLELSTKSKVSYQMLESRDNAMKQQSQAYTAEVDRTSRMRNTNGGGN